MALIKIKQINNSTATSGQVITFDGTKNIWASPPGSDISTFQILGADLVLSEPMSFMIDSTRGNKFLSVESSIFDFGHRSPSNNSWLRPGNEHIDSSKSGFIMPYDGTIVRATAQTNNTNNNSKTFSIFINLIENINILTLSGTGEVKDEVTNVNIDFNAGDKIRVRAKNGTGSKLSHTLVSIWVKWRKV